MPTHPPVGPNLQLLAALEECVAEQRGAGCQRLPVCRLNQLCCRHHALELAAPPPLRQLAQLRCSDGSLPASPPAAAQTASSDKMLRRQPALRRSARELKGHTHQALVPRLCPL